MWRLAGWRTGAVLRRPLLLVLHLGFGWLAFGLFLRGAVDFVDWIAPADAIHALTVGAIGTLTLGMMGRLARTHRRRALAASALDVVSYGLLTGAALARTLLPIAAPDARRAAMISAAALWGSPSRSFSSVMAALSSAAAPTLSSAEKKTHLACACAISRPASEPR